MKLELFIEDKQTSLRRIVGEIKKDNYRKHLHATVQFIKQHEKIEKIKEVDIKLIMWRSILVYSYKLDSRGGDIDELCENIFKYFGKAID